MRRIITFRQALGWSSAVACSWAAAHSVHAQAVALGVQERTAGTHPMRYFVVLPDGWTRAKRWPVVVVIPDANREFAGAARTFAAARGPRPFILVVPLVLGGGGTTEQHKADFDYTPEAWKLADIVGTCRFDDDGMAAVLQDMQEPYNALRVTRWRYRVRTPSREPPGRAAPRAWRRVHGVGILLRRQPVSRMAHGV